MENAITRKGPRQEFGDYGGLTEEAVSNLCILLDTRKSVSRLLTDYLSGTEYISATATKEILKIYFAKCVQDDISNEEAVQYLKQVLSHLNIEEAVRIINVSGMYHRFREQYELLPCSYHINATG